MCQTDNMKQEHNTEADEHSEVLSVWHKNIIVGLLKSRLFCIYRFLPVSNVPWQTHAAELVFHDEDIKLQVIKDVFMMRPTERRPSAEETHSQPPRFISPSAFFIQ